MDMKWYLIVFGPFFSISKFSLSSEVLSVFRLSQSLLEYFCEVRLILLLRYEERIPRNLP